MQKGIIGKKVGMTQVFDEKGNVVPVTVIEAGPCVVAVSYTHLDVYKRQYNMLCKSLRTRSVLHKMWDTNWIKRIFFNI